jgi:hypothetical protein
MQGKAPGGQFSDLDSMGTYSRFCQFQCLESESLDAAKKIVRGGYSQ